MGLNLSFANGFPAVAMHCVPKLRCRYSIDREWADNNMDAYSPAAIKVGPCGLPGSRIGNYGGQVILPLAHTIKHEEVIS
ncbi:hypothetical protein Fmac_014821 [Flemingia macrophylla]|uniref:Uncharacterized protein n=1 Tax=Flemingia macrophylla TaxID=520843 RepID=A0ABD1MCT8_9FABA